MIEQLILVRHGETVLNAAGVAQGWNDSALSEAGQRQAQAIARRLSTMDITAIYSSSLGRALATAEVIATEVALPIVTLDDLREMRYGEWEGMRFLEVRDQYADDYAKWIEDPEYPCPGGESHRDVQIRMERALTHIEASSGSGRQRVVVVTHGTAIRVGATTLLGAPLSTAGHLAQDNASLNLFVRRGDRFVLKVWNDTTHCIEG